MKGNSRFARLLKTSGWSLNTAAKFLWQKWERTKWLMFHLKSFHFSIHLLWKGAGFPPNWQETTEIILSSATITPQSICEFRNQFKIHLFISIFHICWATFQRHILCWLYIFSFGLLAFICQPGGIDHDWQQLMRLNCFGKHCAAVEPWLNYTLKTEQLVL